MSSHDYYGGDGAHGQQQGYGNYPAQQPPYGGQQQYGQPPPNDQYGQGHSPYPPQQVSAIAGSNQFMFAPAANVPAESLWRSSKPAVSAPTAAPERLR
jgi:hypothetical protein